VVQLFHGVSLLGQVIAVKSIRQKLRSTVGQFSDRSPSFIAAGSNLGGVRSVEFTDHATPPRLVALTWNGFLSAEIRWRYKPNLLQWQNPSELPTLGRQGTPITWREDLPTMETPLL
jgi:hypothetical protein